MPHNAMRSAVALFLAIAIVGGVWFGLREPQIALEREPAARPVSQAAVTPPFEASSFKSETPESEQNGQIDLQGATHERAAAEDANENFEAESDFPTPYVQAMDELGLRETDWPDEGLVSRQVRIQLKAPRNIPLPPSLFLVGDVKGTAPIVDGYALFEDLPTGWHTVRAEAIGFERTEEFQIHVRPGVQDLVFLSLRQEAGRSVTFQVRDGSHGHVVRDAKVIALLGTRTVEGTTDYYGEVLMNFPEPLRGYRVVADGYLIAKKFRMKDPLATRVSVELASQGAIVELQMDRRDENETTDVSAYCHDGDDWSFVNAAATDLDGFATIDALPPGDYELRFTHNGEAKPDCNLRFSLGLGERLTLRHSVR